MALQTTRLSTWFKSQLVRKQHQWLQTRKLNLFNWLGFTLREPLKVYEQSGRAVILNTTSLECDDDENEATLNVNLSIENDYSPKYNPNKDVIIRNYSSTLTVSEMETMITAQKGTIDTDTHSVIGQTFAGIIESIPHKLLSDKKTFPFEIGDRVWGVSPSTFGHCWSDYVPVPYKSIAHAPINIPLHFCGLYPMQLLGLQTLLKFAKIQSLTELKNKSVLFIGTGRRSMINTFAPFLKHLGENNNITVIDDVRQCRFDENMLKKYLNIDCFHGLKGDDVVNNTDMLQLKNEYNKSFDIVFDSMAMDKTEILESCKFVKSKGLYVWRQNHMTQFNNNVDLAKWRVALEGAKFLQNIDREIKSQYDGVRFVPNWDKMNAKNGAVLDVYTSYLSEMSFPIIIDRMYHLDDIQNAFNYTLNHDDSVLGESIGVVIEKENDTDAMFFEESVRPKMIKLPPIGNVYNGKQKLKTGNIVHEITSVDDIIECGNQSDVNSYQYGFTQNKTQVLESQTIAKNTSNKA